MFKNKMFKRNKGLFQMMENRNAVIHTLPYFVSHRQMCSGQVNSWKYTCTAVGCVFKTVAWKRHIAMVQTGDC